MKKTIFRIILLFVVLPIVTIGSLVSLNKQGFFNLTDAELHLQKNDHPQFFNPLLNELSTELKVFQGNSLWSINLKKLSQQIKTQKWIKTFSISKQWPDKIKIAIEPHEVTMVIASGDHFYPVISSGDVLDSVSSKEAPDVLLVMNSQFMQNLELRKKAVEVVQQIPIEGTFSQKNISELGFDKKDGFWISMIHDGMQVKLGHENIQLKSARVGQVIDYMETNQFKARVIDADLSKKVLVKLRND